MATLLPKIEVLPQYEAVRNISEASHSDNRKGEEDDEEEAGNVEESCQREYHR